MILSCFSCPVMFSSQRPQSDMVLFVYDCVLVTLLDTRDEHTALNWATHSKFTHGRPVRGVSTYD